MYAMFGIAMYHDHLLNMHHATNAYNAANCTIYVCFRYFLKQKIPNSTLLFRMVEGCVPYYVTNSQPVHNASEVNCLYMTVPKTGNTITLGG